MTPEQSAELDAEIWKPVLGFEGLYEVSNLGRVRALISSARGRWKPGRIIKPKSSKDEYLRINLYDAAGKCKTRTLHSVVLEAFVSPRPGGLICRHLDGNPKNNAAINLAWGTYEQNQDDSRAHGTFCFGEKSKYSKLTDAKVAQLRREWDCGYSARELASLYGICPMAAWRAANQKTWRHVHNTKI